MGFICEICKTYAPLLGRMLLAFVFLQSGFEKALNFEGMLALMTSRGVPEPQILLPIAIAMLFVGGIMILVGWKAPWGAAALMVFMIPATLYFHNYWGYPSEMQLNQFHHFVKNVAIVGALLTIVGMGSGPLSVDSSKDS